MRRRGAVLVGAVLARDDVGPVGCRPSAACRWRPRRSRRRRAGRGSQERAAPRRPAGRHNEPCPRRRRRRSRRDGASVVQGPPRGRVAPGVRRRCGVNWSRASSVPGGACRRRPSPARLSENSEVLPFASVAVAVTKSPTATPLTGAVKVPLALATAELRRTFGPRRRRLRRRRRRRSRRCSRRRRGR